MSRLPWRQLQDVALALLVTGLGLLEVWLPMESLMGEGSPVVSTVGIVAVGALLTQRRTRPWTSVAAFAVWPVLGVLTGGDLQILFLGQLVPFVLLVYSTARHGPGRMPWIGALAGAAVVVTGDVFIDVLSDPGELLFHWGVLTIAYAAGRGLRASEERAAANAVRALEAERATRERALAAVVEERARIARELHDIVAHSVSVMVVQAGAAEQVVTEDPEFARRALATIRASGTSALAEMRRVVAMVRAPEDDPAGLDLAPQPGLDALDELARDASGAGLEVALSVPEDRPRLPAGLDLTAYRIVQEALTNVRRHSRARRADVALDFSGDRLRIRVSDPGPGEARTGEPGHGLIGMRERVALYGGRLDAATDGTGFTVHAELPLEAT